MREFPPPTPASGSPALSGRTKAAAAAPTPAAAAAPVHVYCHGRLVAVAEGVCSGCGHDLAGWVAA